MGMIAAHTPWKIRKRTIKRKKPTMEDIRSVKSVEVFKYLGEPNEKHIIYGDISSLSGTNIMKRIEMLRGIVTRKDLCGQE